MSRSIYIIARCLPEAAAPPVGWPLRVSHADDAASASTHAGVGYVAL